MSYFGKFYLTGPDAKKAADWLFTADVNKKPGQSKKKKTRKKDWQNKKGSYVHRVMKKMPTSEE